MEMNSPDATIVGDINQLPEECISQVISLTTPRDTCVSPVVSRAFRSAADSDATWQRFLPSDYSSFLSQSVDPVEYASKKELYFRLCDHPLLIDGGLMSFGLEKSSGAKCFMLSARALGIVWGTDTRYWKWIALPDSRFSECAELEMVCWLEIHGKIDSRILTPYTAYAAYLVFKLADNTWGLSSPFQTTKITLAGDIISEHLVCLNLREREQDRWWGRPPPGGEVDEMADDVRLPRERQDGWLEVELGEFDSGDGIDGEVDMSFMEIKSGRWKNGLIVQGIEVRPKH
ncbi:F-box protein [Carex littledalei]|uniref:F-box protein n=1 Tax=Carex littledalei TaxID=544730 RepID=A0A833VYP9_9POAL|nr:F-box protein [Carex littledalei]